MKEEKDNSNKLDQQRQQEEERERDRHKDELREGAKAKGGLRKLWTGLKRGVSKKFGKEKELHEQE